MAVANIYVYCGEGGWSVQDVNRFSDSLSMARQWESHEGIHLTSLNVLTNEDSDLFYNQCTIKKLGETPFVGFWNTLQCFQQGFSDNHGEDKVIVLPHPIIGTDLLGIPILESCPDRGSLDNAPKGSTEEDRALVKEEQLYPIQQYDNWWNDETDMCPFWIATTAQTSKFIFNTIKEFHEEILEDYDANAYGLQQWIECELEPQLFWLNHPHGLISPYAIGDKDTQLARNELWEANVRPHFQNMDDGYGWRGLGGDEEALLFEYDHEYRSVSRQVSFIAFEGDTAVAEEDEYCRWWILKG
tara:strand:+ start:4819 stop:5718 length:900 start_codon:yes stop_codon:yes gene_type:complete